MLRISAVLLVALFASGIAVAQGEPPPPIKLTVHAQKLATPALKYHLLPELRDQKPGDAGPLYRKAAELLAQIQGKGEPGIQWDEAVAQWQQKPLSELKRDELRRFVERHAEVFPLLDQAARCERCDWALTEELRRRGIGARIEVMQSMRGCATLLILRARLALIEGRLDAALRDMQSLLSLAHQVGQAPTLICSLIGVSLASQTLAVLDEFVQQEKAPNLYWALTDLPRPFVDFRRGFEGERVTVYATFPGLAGAASDLRSGPLPAEQVPPLLDNFLSLSDNRARNLTDRVTLARAILARHEIAKKALIEHGRPRELVEAMPHIQVAVLHGLLEYERVIDEVLKWQSFPYWEAHPGSRRSAISWDKHADPKRPDAPALTLIGLLLPGSEKMFDSRVRLDRRLAALRCVEALRLHAAANKGKLPATLDAIKDVPLPLDPATGKPFAYTVKGDVVTLFAPQPDNEERLAPLQLTYEVKLAR
jgi:hypothetical protein